MRAGTAQPHYHHKRQIVTVSSQCPMALNLFPKRVPAFADWGVSPPPASSCYSASAGALLMHFVCVHRRATLLDWPLRVLSCSIELDVALSTSANTPAKTGTVHGTLLCISLTALLTAALSRDCVRNISIQCGVQSDCAPASYGEQRFRTQP